MNEVCSLKELRSNVNLLSDSDSIGINSSADLMKIPYDQWEYQENSQAMLRFQYEDFVLASFFSEIFRRTTIFDKKECASCKNWRIKFVYRKKAENIVIRPKEQVTVGSTSG